MSQVIADASAVAYKGATNEVQAKLRKVVEVWRQRQIFEPSILMAIESRVSGTWSGSAMAYLRIFIDLDKSKGGKKPLLGGSLFSSSGPSAPPEIQPLIPLQITVNKAKIAAKTASTSAYSEYDKLMDPNVTGVSPPRQSAQLGGLLKTLAHAEHSVAESIKARKSLVESLEKLLEGYKAEIVIEDAEQLELGNRKATIDAKKQEIETVLLREMSEGGRSVDGSPIDGSPDGYMREPEAPEIEPLSPPVEALTPEGSPNSENAISRDLPSGAINSATQYPILTTAQSNPSPAPGSDLLSSLAVPEARRTSGSPVNGFGMKKRKFNDDEFSAMTGGDAMEGLDEDVAEMLK
jgi:regulator of Ty1 transposition protein 103